MPVGARCQSKHGREGGKVTQGTEMFAWEKVEMMMMQVAYIRDFLLRLTFNFNFQEFKEKRMPFLCWSPDFDQLLIHSSPFLTHVCSKGKGEKLYDSGYQFAEWKDVMMSHYLEEGKGKTKLTLVAKGSTKGWLNSKAEQQKFFSDAAAKWNSNGFLVGPALKRENEAAGNLTSFTYFQPFFRAARFRRKLRAIFSFCGPRYSTFPRLWALF